MRTIGARAALALCLTLTLAGLGGGGWQASAAARPPRAAAARSEAEGLAALRAWMQQVMAWSQPYVTLQEDFVNWVVALAGDIEKATDYRHDPKAGAAWAKAWAPTQHARLAELRARSLALKGEPFPKAPAALGGIAQIRIVTANMVGLPFALDRLLAETAPTLHATIDTIAQAAAGDADAGKRLPGEAIGLDIALAKASMNSPDSAAGIPNHPLSDIHAAFQATWRADIAAEQAAQDVLSGKPVDRGALSATLRTEAAKTDAALDSATRHIAVMRRSVVGMPDLAMKQSIARLLDSMAETVSVFGEVAAVWRTLADKVDDPKSGPWDWVDGAAKVQEPLDRIAKQTAERRRMLGAL